MRVEADERGQILDLGRKSLDLQPRSQPFGHSAEPLRNSYGAHYCAFWRIRAEGLTDYLIGKLRCIALMRIDAQADLAAPKLQVPRSNRGEDAIISMT
jgi:hypothetical protein